MVVFYTWLGSNEYSTCTYDCVFMHLLVIDFVCFMYKNVLSVK